MSKGPIITRFERPRWMARAACRGTVDPRLFFPTGRGIGQWWALALRPVCRDCPVRAHCLAWAIDHVELGLWAGTTEDCRMHLRRVTCAECRAELDPIDVWHGRVLPCDACRDRIESGTSSGRRARQSWRLITKRAS
jgi:WhiB family redox-sensing transcriptional regulator